MTVRILTARAGALLVMVALSAGTGCGARGSLLGAESGSGSTGAGGASVTGTGTAGSTGTGGGVPLPPPGPCQPGDAPVMLVSGEQNARAIALDDGGVYYTVYPDETPCTAQPGVKRVPKQGGPAEVVGKAMRGLGALAVDAQSLYWSDDPVSPCTDPADPGYIIVAGPKAGGAPVPFPPSEQVAPAQQIAVDTGYVYWTQAKGGIGLWRAPKGGGATQLFAMVGAGAALALDGTNVYWNAAPGVIGAPEASGNPTVKLTAPSGSDVQGIAVADGEVYFSSQAPCQGAKCDMMGFMSRAPAGGGAVASITTTPDLTPIGNPAIGPSSVYWAVSKVTGPGVSGAVLRAPRTGGPAETIKDGGRPWAIAADASCVYWTDVGDGSIWRAPL